MQSALLQLISSSEDNLMGRILAYAKRQDFTKYTSTLEEAWRLSISGLSRALIGALERSAEVPELRPDERYEDDPMSAFGVLEARRHRERGVSLEMFLGLFKYYKQCYVDLLLDAGWVTERQEQGRLWIERSFDRMEIAFVSSWAQLGQAAALEELQTKNRSMTNEKNRLLTVVESFTNPAFLLDQDDRMIYQNTAASKLISDDPSTRSEYYQAPSNPFQEPLDAASADAVKIDSALPWIADTLKDFRRGGREAISGEVSLGQPESQRTYAIQLTHMRDVSGKYPGTVILLSDVTEREQLTRRLERSNRELTEALALIESLEGILPICASCKKIRDTEERWVPVEVYMRDHTKADFTHSICPECGERIYGRAAEDTAARKR